MTSSKVTRKTKITTTTTTTTTETVDTSTASDPSKAKKSGAPGAKKYVHIWRQQSGKKSLTTVQGLRKEHNYEEILKKLKDKFRCDVKVVEDKRLGKVIQFQSDQHQNVSEYLVTARLVKKDQIKIHGAPRAKEDVHIWREQRNGKKSLIVQGLRKEYSYETILQNLKKKFCCDGKVVRDKKLGDKKLGKVIQLQSDQHKNVSEYLVTARLVKKDQIKTHGF